MSIQDFIRGSLDSALPTLGATPVVIAGKTYQGVFDDATSSESLADAGYEPGDICSVVISASQMTEPPTKGTTVTVRGEDWRLYQSRRKGRAAFTLYLTDPDSSQ